MNPSPDNNNTEEGCKTYKQRFKGIETFLRRVAFNLGNSPSQTEVKIISCVPIDVTDLQNKIINLERQLQEVKNPKPQSTGRKTPVHTALLETSVGKAKPFVSDKCRDVNLDVNLDDEKTMASRCEECSRRRKSTVSFLFPSWSINRLTHNRSLVSTEKEEPKEVPHKNFFRKTKKLKPITKKDKQKPQLVYYAHTENYPFNNYGFSTENTLQQYPKPNIDTVFSKTYIANVIQKHFDPKHVVEEFSDTSNFTSPVCRDFQSRGNCPYESDVCSCCHGQFQNIDNYIGKNQTFIVDPITTHLYNQFNKASYYDANLYDVVPVKEKANKISKEEKPLKKNLKCQVDLRCWPDKSRYKSRHTATPVHHQVKIPGNTKSQRTPATRVRDTKDNVKKNQSNAFKQTKVDQEIGRSDTSNSCCVDYGEIYTKPYVPIHRTDMPGSMRQTFSQNAECLTIDVGPKNLTITRSIQIDINSAENKTEETLNQIKSILQSVLAEVKTNPQVNNYVPEDKTKIDAVVQKGSSQSNIQTCSSLLHSFTYNNSCNANSYMATCSRQMPSHFCYTNVPCERLKCTQNFPLLVHSPGHPMYGCFYANNSQTNKRDQKQAATTSTNTETEDHENKGHETQKLIKEIYKSIALTMDIPKETSNSVSEDLKSVTNNSTNGSVPKEIRSAIITMSNVQRRDIQIEASMTPLSTSTVKSKCNTSSVGTRSDTKLVEEGTNLQYESQSTETDIEAKEDIRARPKMTVASTISEHDSEDLSTETEDEDVVETMENIKLKTEKKGLFKRMLRSVNLFNKKKHNDPNERSKMTTENKSDNENSESDSDEYQTIYSGKSNKTYYPNRRQHYQPKSYIAQRPKQQRTRGIRRSPYMEQEYRRQWDENLIFQENRKRTLTTERPFSRQTPLYWQNIDARSAVVDHRTPQYNKQYHPTQNVNYKVERRTSPIKFEDKNLENKPKVSWLKKHKLELNCGEQWKQFILEN